MVGHWLLSLSILLMWAGCSLGVSEENYLSAAKDAITLLKANPKAKEQWRHRAEHRDDRLPPIDFECTVETSPTRPRSVHELRPGDINVIAAFGDSVTAGNGLGAEDLIDVALQNRGESWSVGGERSLEEGVITLANILKKFNPNLKGYSLDYSWVFDEEAWLNVAEPGARSVHLPEQADDLIEKIWWDERIDWDNDWKLATLFIGGNDLCGYCRDRDGRSPEKFKERIKEVLDKLYQDVPRMLVQLVPMFDVTPLSQLSDNLVCDLLQEQFCSCALNVTTRRELRPVQVGYYQGLKELAEDPRYDGRLDFTVVLQPHMRDLPLPRDENGDADRSYFSPDCFHPGRKGHQALALGLWNTMLVKVGEKTLNYPLDAPPSYSCPTLEEPFIFTKRNSVVDNKALKPVPHAADGVENAIDNSNQGSQGFTGTHGIIVGVVGGVLLVGTVAAVSLVVYQKRKVKREEEELVEEEEQGNTGPVEGQEGINMGYTQES